MLTLAKARLTSLATVGKVSPADKKLFRLPQTASPTTAARWRYERLGPAASPESLLPLQL